MLIDNKIIAELKALGLKEDDNVFIHSAFRKANVDANIFINTLKSYFKNRIMMPSHTWGVVKNNGDVFDVRNTKSNLGILNELFRQSEGVRRSLHPTHSILVYGNPDIISEDMLATTPCGPKTCYHKFFDYDVKIVLLGVDHTKNTYIHSLEEKRNVLNRLTKEFFKFKVIDYDSLEKEVLMQKHYSTLHSHISYYYERLEPIFIKRNLEKIGLLAGIETRVISAKAISKVVDEVLANDKQVLLEKPDILINYL